jgi:hypothetical protein
MERNIKEYGVHLSEPEGFIVEIGDDLYNHKFGGSSWHIVDNLSGYSPTLLLVLDLLDPKLKALKTDLKELPLCSHLDCSAWTGKQHFKLNTLLKTLTLVSLEIVDFENWYAGFTNPLSEKSIKLSPVEMLDYPITETLYWQACERFLNSDNFIRVLGSPLWMELEQKQNCSCGKSMQYICSIGHQSDLGRGYVDDTNFYIGEGSLYFFLCPDCLLLTVISQSV